MRRSALSHGSAKMYFPCNLGIRHGLADGANGIDLSCRLPVLGSTQRRSLLQPQPHNILEPFNAVVAAATTSSETHQETQRSIRLLDELGVRLHGIPKSRMAADRRRVILGFGDAGSPRRSAV